MGYYKIIYCFLNRDGSIQRDEFEKEEYWSEDITAENEEQAEKKFRAYFEAKKMNVEIIDIIERR